MRLIRNTALILLEISLLSCLFVCAQTNNGHANSIPYSLRQYPQEKAYLHFDNTSYYPGETIWFKAYVVTAEKNALSQMSKTLYAELLTPEGKILSTKKLKIEDGECCGEFLLQDSLRSGFYEVRAYTRYMLNEGEEGIFSRIFPVYVKPEKRGDYTIHKIKEQYYSERIPRLRKEYKQKGSLSLDFYPEGGNLVAGLESKVAFKATGAEGKNAFIVGEIRDDSGNKVAEVETSYLGMGAFSFTPDGGRYTAKVYYNDKNYSFELPRALSSGYTMTVDNTREKLNILICKSRQVEQDTLELAVSCRGRLYASDRIPMNRENLVSLNLSHKLLPSGVSRITLFNKSGLISERLVFINHNSQMKISVAQDKPFYHPFEKVNMSFQINDMKGSPVKSSFSLSVRDAGSSANNPYADNILTNLLLSSELKGYIENPGYYFESDSPARKGALDLLMLIQGWSRSVRKEELVPTKQDVKYPVEKSLVIEGRVLSLMKKKPKANVEVLMFIMQPDSASQRGTCMTDEEGRFNFALNDFTGRAQLTLQTKENGKKKENTIVLDRMFSPEVKMYAFQEKQKPENFIFKIDSGIPQKHQPIPIDDQQIDLKNNTYKTNELPIDKKNHLLKEIEVKGRKQFKREGESLRNASIVYDIEKETDEIIDRQGDIPSSILDFLVKQNPYFSYQLDKVLPLKEGRNSGNYSLDALHARYKGRNVIFCLNNNSLADVDAFGKIFNVREHDNDLKNIYSNQVEKVMIVETNGNSLFYKGKADIGFITGQEVIVFIYTYLDFRFRNNLHGIRQTKLDGYAPTKEFYSPNYEHTPLPEEKDYRRTLYWNPNVRTDADGKASVSFYNNATCKQMSVSAETVTENGMMGTLNQ